MHEVNKYTYTVAWSDEDNRYVGVVAEFPSLSHLAKSMLGSLMGIRNLVASVLAEMRESGETPPAPGTTCLRVPSHIEPEVVERLDAARANTVVFDANSYNDRAEFERLKRADVTQGKRIAELEAEVTRLRTASAKP